VYSTRKRRSPFRWIFLLLFVIVGAGGGLAAIYFFSPDWSHPTPPTPTAEVAIAATAVPTVIPDAPAAPTVRPDIPEGTRILIPSAGVVAPIVQVYLDGQSWDITHLGNNVGHLKGTAWLPATGNVVLLGHVELSDGGKGIFASLKDMHADDVIILETDSGEFRYQVSSVYETDPSDLTPLYPNDTSILTLITCDDYDFISNTYRTRTIVVAEMVA
jgi:LPXTG-site transpeptidase (sortase) family protein